jgi:uncharacterized protein YyaL (SSP411 family)
MTKLADHKNRLAVEKSPYLLQHARNPVDWHPWGEEAFEKARRENKPIFLSIGYSTCHWCHVMAHESFEDDAVAEIMNREFVNIKVDREERPDVDRVYMTFVQATTGHGGWPMSVWLTPDLQPFVGGTYFPPEDRYGHPGFKRVLQRIADAWQQDREKVAGSGERIVEALRESQRREPEQTHSITESVLDAAYAQFERVFDPVEGGFGNAPKFPHPVTLNFLSRYHARHRGIGFQPMNPSPEHLRAADATKHSLEMLQLTLRKMAAGGMHDHIGGGFHRYSVDRYWHVPHFEKMLYDQAQLVLAYLDAFQITHDPTFASVARDVLDYVLRDMTSPNGGFYSAEDADSAVPQSSVAAVYLSRRSDAEEDDRRGAGSGAIQDGGHRPPLQQNAEGAFYVWTCDEINSALGNDAEIFNFHYGVEPHGNVLEGSDPHDEFREKNILIQRHTVAETAERFRKSEEDIEQILARSRATLFEIRAKRPRPHLDDKILSSWNGLMISAFARAAQVLDEPRYREAAIRAAQFVTSDLYDAKAKMLYRSFREGRSNIEGFADDYAFLIQGLLDLYEAGFEVRWLKLAVQLQEIMDQLFYDSAAGGYFSTSGKDKSVFLRMKDDNDSAEPAASSIAALNLLRLAQIRNNQEYQERAERAIAAFSPTLSRFPSAMPQMLCAVEFSLNKPQQIVIAGDPESSNTKALLAEAHRHFMPNKILLLADAAEGQSYLGETNQALRSMSPINGKPAAYVCENFTCQAPVTDPKELRRLLSGEAS